MKIYTIKEEVHFETVQDEGDKKYAKLYWKGEDYLKEIVQNNLHEPEVLLILPNLATYLYVVHTYWLPRNFKFAILDGKPTFFIEEKRINYSF